MDQVVIVVLNNSTQEAQIYGPLFRPLAEEYIERIKQIFTASHEDVEYAIEELKDITELLS